MMNTVFFIFLAYGIVALTLFLFVYHAFRMRRQFLQKLHDEGFL